MVGKGEGWEERGRVGVICNRNLNYRFLCNQNRYRIIDCSHSMTDSVCCTFSLPRVAGRKSRILVYNFSVYFYFAANWNDFPLKILKNGGKKNCQHSKRSIPGRCYRYFNVNNQYLKYRFLVSIHPPLPLGNQKHRLRFVESQPGHHEWNHCQANHMDNIGRWWEQ